MQFINLTKKWRRKEGQWVQNANKKGEKVRGGEGLMVSEKEVIKKWENGGGGVVFEINFFCLKLTKESGMEK